MDHDGEVTVMPNPLAQLGTRVDLRVRAYNLDGMSPGSTPVSFAVIFVRNQQAGAQWHELSRSKEIHDTASPVFPGVFATEYKFQLFQELRICIFDKAEVSDDLGLQFLLGVCDTTLGKLVAARGAPVQIPLTKDGAQLESYIEISAQEVEDAKTEVTMSIGLQHLMTHEESEDQRAFLEHLGSQLNVASTAPAVMRRPVAAIVNRLKKDPKIPAVRPAHIENVTHLEEQHKADVMTQIAEVTENPPPFVPYLVLYSAPDSAIYERDPYTPSIEWTEVYRSKDCMRFTDEGEGVTLAPFTVPQMVLNGGDENRLIKFAIMRSKEGATIQVGAYVTSLRALRDTVRDPSRETILHLAPPPGVLIVRNYSERVLPSFMDMMRESSLDVSLIVGIDYTQSNGPIDDRTSLHYIGGPPGSNPYEAAIQTIGNMLSVYSADQSIAAYGFGAKVPPTGEVSHCFSLTGDPYNPLCDNVGAVLMHYRNVLTKVQTWGPTMFSELLNTVSSIVAKRAAAAGSSCTPYTCVLIITDGVISDMERSKAELIKLSHLPVSVLIVGVGRENFSKLKTLDDGEGRPVQKKGNQVAVRRFVKFVDFASFSSADGQTDMARISETVLGIIPEHSK
jgi:hypothetical protein